MTRISSILIALLLAASAFAQTGTAVARVIDDRGESIPGSVIILTRSQRHGAIVQNTRVVLRDLLPGSDTLQVVASCGYYKMTVPIDVKSDTVTASTVELAEVTITPRKAQTHLPGTHNYVCGTPDYADGPPKDYATTHSKVSYFAGFASVNGTITDEDQHAISNAWIGLLDSKITLRPDSLNDGFIIGYAMSDAKGTFRLDSVVPGRYVVWAKAQGSQSDTLRVDLSDGESKALKIHLLKSAVDVKTEPSSQIPSH